MKPVDEVIEILKNNDIEPARDEYNNQPLVWLTSQFVAVEVTSRDHRERAVEFLGKSFDDVTFSQMNNGNYLIRASALKESVKRELSH